MWGGGGGGAQSAVTLAHLFPQSLYLLRVSRAEGLVSGAWRVFLPGREWAGRGRGAAHRLPAADSSFLSPGSSPAKRSWPRGQGQRVWTVRCRFLQGCRPQGHVCPLHGDGVRLREESEELRGTVGRRPGPSPVAKGMPCAVPPPRSPSGVWVNGLPRSCRGACERARDWSFLLPCT